MATKIVFDHEQETAFIKRTGHIDPGEMLRGTEDLISNPLFKSMRKSLSDVSTADFSDIPTKEFEAHAEYCSTVLKGLFVAIFAPDDLSFGISRRFETLSNKRNTLVTRDIQKALSWLDVTLPEAF